MGESDRRINQSTHDVTQLGLRIVKLLLQKFDLRTVRLTEFRRGAKGLPFY